MFKKRRVVIALLVAGIIGVVIGVLALLPARQGVTKANFDRIEIGMTRPDVEAILGPPSDLGLMRRGLLEFDSDVTDDFAQVMFDENNLVRTKEWVGFPDERSWWQQLLERTPWHEKLPPRIRIFT